MSEQQRGVKTRRKASWVGRFTVVLLLLLLAVAGGASYYVVMPLVVDVLEEQAEDSLVRESVRFVFARPHFARRRRVSLRVALGRRGGLQRRLCGRRSPRQWRHLPECRQERLGRERVR